MEKQITGIPLKTEGNISTLEWLWKYVNDIHLEKTGMVTTTFKGV